MPKKEDNGRSINESEKKPENKDFQILKLFQINRNTLIVHNF